MAARQTGGQTGGFMWQAIYRAAVLTLLLQEACSQSFFSVSSLNGETNSANWAVNRTDTLSVDIAYACQGYSDWAYVYLLRDQVCIQARVVNES